MEPPKPISSKATFVQLLLAIDKRLEEKSQVAHKHDQFMQENTPWGHSLIERFLQVNEEWQRTEKALADAHVSFLEKAFHGAHSLEFSCIMGDVTIYGIYSGLWEFTYIFIGIKWICFGLLIFTDRSYRNF